jgi:3-keto-disaccharide hydrolase
MALLLVAAPTTAQRGFKPLFNGKDLTGWHLHHADRNGWKVEEGGVLTNTSPSSDLISDEKFRDFEVHYEYKVPKGSNSGFYLRGRYEIQILDSYGKPPESHEDGAIYGQFAPKEIASKPAGEWNVVDAKLVGQHVTVTENGKPIIDAELNKGVTGAALDDKEAEPGPVYLQGDHGIVSFRNIRIHPL